jgi:hypothetical protein
LRGVLEGASSDYSVPDPVAANFNHSEDSNPLTARSYQPPTEQEWVVGKSARTKRVVRALAMEADGWKRHRRYRSLIINVIAPRSSALSHHDHQRYRITIVELDQRTGGNPSSIINAVRRVMLDQEV